MVGRPQVHPNYGFIKQLDVFEKCGYEPSSLHPQYRSWKRRHVQDVNNYLNHLVDTVAIIPDKLLMTRFVGPPIILDPFPSSLIRLYYPLFHPTFLVNFQTIPSRPSSFSKKSVLLIYYPFLLPKIPSVPPVFWIAMLPLTVSLLEPYCAYCLVYVITFVILWRVMGWSLYIVALNLGHVRRPVPTVSFPLA